MLEAEIKMVERKFRSTILTPGKNPRIEQGLAMVISELAPAKSIYADILESSHSLKKKVITEVDYERVVKIVEAAKSGFIAIQNVIDALYRIRCTLMRPPVNFLPPPVRKEKRNE